MFLQFSLGTKVSMVMMEINNKGDFSNKKKKYRNHELDPIIATRVISKLIYRLSYNQ